MKSVISKLAEKTKQHTDLLSVKKETPVIQVMKHRELSRRIALLSEEIEELKTEKENLLISLKCAGEKELPSVQKKLERLENTLKEYEAEEQKYIGNLETVSKEFALYKEKATAFDTDELGYERLKLREQKEKETVQKLKAVYGKDYDPGTFMSCHRETDYYLNDAIDEVEVRWYKKRKLRQTRQQEPMNKSKHERER